MGALPLLNTDRSTPPRTVRGTGEGDLTSSASGYPAYGSSYTSCSFMVTCARRRLHALAWTDACVA
jgi:hypothetical protein